MCCHLCRIFILTGLLLLSAIAANARPVTLVAVGDIMLAGSSAGVLQRTGYDYPFAALTGRLRDCDLAVGNLEAPITSSGREFTGKKFRFRTDALAAAALQRAGFGVLTLANNHMMDFGENGLLSTLRHLDAQGIRHAGAGADLASARQAAIVTACGARIAFLAFSLTYPKEFYAGEQRAGTAQGDHRHIAEDVASARSSADYVVVSFHWGGEGESRPRSYQVKAAHLAIDAGADVVLGHHPHVLQGVERYGRGVILYSLGNFAFGSMSRKSGESVLARIVLDGGVRELELVPLNVLNRQVRFQPREIEGQHAGRLMDRINRLSAGLNGRMVRADGRYLLRAP